MAQRTGCTRIPIVPAGLVYRPGPRWEATLRFTAPLYVAGRADRAAVVRMVEEQVRLLSTSGSVGPHADVYETSAVGDA